jgi:predicted phosphodiesterase
MTDTLPPAQIQERLRVLHKHDGNFTNAAKELGIGRSTLQQTIQIAEREGITIATKLDTEDSLKAKVRKLEAQLEAVTRQNLEDEHLLSSIFGVAQVEPNPPKWLSELTPAKAPGIPTSFWSDWHLGEYVSFDQMDGLNVFNATIAHERIERLISITIDLTKNHMVNPEYPGIVVPLGGDIITGTIHDELRETNDLTLPESMIFAQDELAMGLEAMLNEFDRVYVPCVIGNHGRGTLKPRAKNRVADSMEWLIYANLKRYFNDNDRIQIDIAKSTDIAYRIFDHRYLLTHGDSLGVKGGDGIIGALGPIARGAIKVGRTEGQVGRAFDTLVMGHYHTYIARGEAVPVIVNGALKGLDEYAKIMLRARFSRASQALWFTHPKHGITAQWQMFLQYLGDNGAGQPWVSWK